MRRSKAWISQALSTLQGNMDRTGDPLGFRNPYWIRWAEGLNLPREGKTVLFTGRMYQMLPFVVQATQLVTAVRPLLAVRGFDKLLAMGNRVAGPSVIRLKARGERALAERGEIVLRGILAALRAAGERPAYLYEAEPYSGVLPHDLGLEEKIARHVGTVYRLLKQKGVQTVITVDPHTTYMLKEIYPTYIQGFDIQVRHYLEPLSEGIQEAGISHPPGLPEAFVLHDPCVMARDLGMTDEIRKVVRTLGVSILEPQNTKLDTACCGGPVEYAFADLSEQISSIRAKELAGISRDVLALCPICLINLLRHERELGIRVWDLGEVLYALMTE
ncbi:MAG: (Fe-S)-binding protein [Deltaproteobacteria bacterium]|nr:(Fe-S)-binding protein [Deltaproteobacteria bacterium]